MIWAFRIQPHKISPPLDKLNEIEQERWSLKQFKVMFSTFLPSRNFATKATFFLVAFVTDKKKAINLFIWTDWTSQEKKKVLLRFVSIVAQEENR